MISIEIATRDALTFIAKNLRADDRRELAATSISDDPSAFLPDKVMALSLLAFVARHNTVPVSAWGLVPMWPGVGNAFAFGTSDWGHALLAMTKHVRRFMIPFLLDNGYHRIECRSLATRADVARWLRLFDAEMETVLRSSGKRGEDFVLFRWLSDERRRATKSATLSRH